jgi:hypothetical protein
MLHNFMHGILQEFEDPYYVAYPETEDRAKKQRQKQN